MLYQIFKKGECTKILNKEKCIVENSIINFDHRTEVCK